MPGSRISSRSRSTAAKGSPCSGGDCGQPRAHLARLDLRQHRQLADALEEARHPLDRGVRRPRGSSRQFFLRAAAILDLRPGARVQYLLVRQPCAPRLCRGRARCSRGAGRCPSLEITILAACLAGESRMSVAQVEPVGLAVHLERGSGLDRLGDDALESMSSGARACRSCAPVGWPMQSTCGFSIAPSMRSVGLRSKRGVDRGDHPVEPRQHLVGEVERSRSARMVDLDAVRMRKGARRAFSASISSRLRLEPSLAQVVGVIGDREVLVAARHRGERHLLDRALARPPTSVVCACRSPRRSPTRSTSAGSVAAARRLELAGVLAQLGRDVLVAEELVELLLGAGGVRSRPSRPSVTPYSEIESPRRTASSRSATLCSFEPVKCWSRLP